MRLIRRSWLVAVAALGALGTGAPAQAQEQVGDPLPAVTRAWDALSASFDDQAGRDILLTRHQTVDGFRGGVYLSNGLGGWMLDFRFPSSRDRHGCDAGLINGDSRVDFYCAVGADKGTGDGLNELWLQWPNGSFVNRGAEWGVEDPLGRGRRPILYDHNGDGRLDLYVTNAERQDGAHPGNRFWVNVRGKFRERVTAATGNLGFRCVDSGDLQGDGWIDLAVCGDILRLLKNTGFGHNDVSNLTGAPINNPRDVRIAELNSDGLADLAIVRRTGVELRFNRGFGQRFARVNASAPLVNGQRALVRDMTGDGVRDVYVTDGCDASGANAPDTLLVGPDWLPVTPAGDPVGGCGNEVIDADRLVVFNGDGDDAGPVTVREYPIWP